MKNYNCNQCGKAVNQKEMVRKYGKYSSVINGGFCSAGCYTQSFQTKLTHDAPATGEEGGGA